MIVRRHNLLEERGVFSYSESIYDVPRRLGRNGDTGTGWYFTVNTAISGNLIVEFIACHVRWDGKMWSYNGGSGLEMNLALAGKSLEIKHLDQEIERQKPDFASVVVLERALKDFLRRLKAQRARP